MDNRRGSALIGLAVLLLFAGAGVTAGETGKGCHAGAAEASGTVLHRVVYDTVAYVPHVANVGGWRTLLVINNAGPETCQGNISLYGDGSVLEQLPFSIDSGKAGTVALGQGACVKVEYTGGSVFILASYVNDTGGGIAEFLVDGALSPSLSFNLPQYLSAQLDWEGIALFNPGETEAVVTLEALDVGGTVLGTSQVAIPARTNAVREIGKFFTGVDYHTVARVSAVSDHPLSGINISGHGVSQLLFTRATAPEGKLPLRYIPHIGNVFSLWQNRLVFDNPSASDAVVTVRLFAGGSEAVTREMTVPAGQNAVLDLNQFAAHNVTCGIVENCPSSLDVRLSFVYASSGATAEFLLDGRSSGRLVYNFPAYSADILDWMGIGVFNPGETAATVAVKAFKNGAETGSTSLELPPRNRTAIMLETLLPTAYEQGIERVEIDGDVPLCGLNISGAAVERLLFTPSEPVYGAQLVSTPVTVSLPPAVTGTLTVVADSIGTIENGATATVDTASGWAGLVVLKDTTGAEVGMAFKPATDKLPVTIDVDSTAKALVMALPMEWGKYGLTVGQVFSQIPAAATYPELRNAVESVLISNPTLLLDDSNPVCLQKAVLVAREIITITGKVGSEWASPLPAPTIQDVSGPDILIKNQLTIPYGISVMNLSDGSYIPYCGLSKRPYWAPGREWYSSVFNPLGTRDIRYELGKGDYLVCLKRIPLAVASSVLNPLGMIPILFPSGNYTQFGSAFSLLLNRDFVPLDLVKADAEIKGCLGWTVKAVLIAIAFVPGCGDAVSIVGDLSADIMNDPDVGVIETGKSLLQECAASPDACGIDRMVKAADFGVGTAFRAGSVVRRISSAYFHNAGNHYVSIIVEKLKTGSKILKALSNVSFVGDILDGLTFICHTALSDDMALYRVNQNASGVASINTYTPFIPSIPSFTADAPTISPGQSTKLRWVVSNVKSLSIDQGVGDVTARTYISVSPSQTTTYTLKASNWFGSATAQTTVAVTDQGLIAYYPFNGNANDESGNGRHGVVNNVTLTTDRFGNSNKAYSFNGTSSYISISTSLAIQSISISAWIQGDKFGDGGTSSNEIVTFNNNGTGNSFDVMSPSYQSQSGKPRWEWGGNTIQSSTNINTNWHHVVGTFDYNSGSMLLYLDGSLVASGSGTGSINATLISIGYGVGSGGSAIKWAGKIDEVRIYNRVLSLNEVQALFTN